MPISFGGKPKEEDVVSLIAAKKYSRAIEVLKAQLQRRGANPSLRMQLADVLLLAEKKKEAIALLLPLADQYATEGFAAKAVSVLKKIQKIDPGRRDVDTRLARLIEEKQREASAPATRGAIAGIEEAPAAEESSATPGVVDGPVLEIGLETIAPISAPAEPVAALEKSAVTPAPESTPATPPPVRAAAGAPPAPIRPATPPVAAPSAAPPGPLEPPPVLAVPVLAAPVLAAPVLAAPVLPAPVLAAAPPPPAEAPSADTEIEDYDLLYSADGEDEQEVVLEAEVVEESAPGAEPMSATQFADELMGLVDSVFQEFPGASQSPAPAAGGAPAQGRQIVVSPLFRDFSVDEMVAVIEGLKLLTFERGNVILKEGQPGASLYMLTSGRVRAFRRNAETGRQDVLGDLKEGAFFGEVSILTGHPRMASVVALTRCELLELDRSTLDEITKTHPRVWDVLREFATKRAG